MTTSELRTVALTVKQRIETMRDAVSPAYNEVETWILNAADESLPTIAQVKAALAAYEVFSKPPLSLYDEVRLVKSAADIAVPLSDTAEFAALDHAHTTADISDFPAAMTPLAHGHVKADISNFPAAMTPLAHGHVKADISDFPTALVKTAMLLWVGNGLTNRVISLPFALKALNFINQEGFAGRIDYAGNSMIYGQVQRAGMVSLTINSITLLDVSLNKNNVWVSAHLIGDL